MLASREWIENELADFPGELALLSQYLDADDGTFVELMLRFIASFEDEEFYDGFLAYGKEELKETYTEDELKEFKGKTFNQQKILNIYRRKKYGAKKLFAKTKCVKCGREKTVFLSNLVRDPDKYGSCVCSNDNVDAKVDSATAFYNGTKRLSSNTSGYTGVSYVKTYDGKPYDK